MSQPRLPSVGDRASLSHVFTREDVAEFARLSGDDNPVHLDDQAARQAGFAGIIVHGMLAAGLISRVLGTQLPGPGTIYLSQEMRFRRPVYPGQRVTPVVEVVVRREDKPIIELATRVEADGEVALDGTATVLVRSIT